MPTTTGKATELITFSRGTLATVTDSDGKIKWAPHNLLTNSEQFDASYWTKTAVTVTANSTAAPNGTTTADTIASSNSSTGNTGVYTNTSSLPAGYTMSVFVKAGTSSIAWISGDSAQSYGVFNLATGSIIASANGTASILAVGNGWFNIAVANTTVSNNFVIIGGKDSYTSGHPWGNGTWTSGNTIYAWGAHLYRSDLGGMQANASAYPMYNPSTPKNLLGQSEDFANAAWNKQNATAVSATLAAPNGSNVVSLITATSNDGRAQRFDITTLSGTTYTMSAWLKRKTGSGAVRFYCQSAPSTGFSDDLGITTEWARYSWTFTATSTAANIRVPHLSVSGDEVYIWGAQLSDSASLDAYSPVFGAAPSAAAYHGPRLDYDPVTLSARGLLVEEARTNLLTYSEAFNQSSVWQPVEVSVTTNAASSPAGTTTADLVIPSTNSAGHFLYNTSFSQSGGTFSVYAKASGYNWIALSITGVGSAWFNVSTGVVGTVQAGITAFTPTKVGDFYRCTIAYSGAATRCNIGVHSADNQTAAWSGDGTSGVLFWGAQLEAGAFATSYIPTAAATVTRNGDVASVGVSQFPYSATEGTIVANVDVFSVANPNAGYLYNLAIDNDNRISGWIWNGAPTAPRATIRAGAGPDQADITNGTVSANTAFKTALAYKANDFAFSLNGSAPTPDTSGSLPAAPSVFALGSTGSIGFLNGHIRQITYLPRRLTNAELAARSA